MHANFALLWYVFAWLLHVCLTRMLICFPYASSTCCFHESPIVVPHLITIHRIHVVNTRPWINVPIVNARPQLNVPRINARPQINVPSINDSPQINVHSINARPQINVPSMLFLNVNDHPLLFLHHAITPIKPKHMVHYRPSSSHSFVSRRV